MVVDLNSGIVELTALRCDCGSGSVRGDCKHDGTTHCQSRTLLCADIDHGHGNTEMRCLAARRDDHHVVGAGYLRSAHVHSYQVQNDYVLCINADVVILEGYL